MNKKILVTGLCTLHWGRLQYGNVGNYYIIEPLFRLIHSFFPDYDIVTTFQMDDEFVKNEKVNVLPMELYYSWDENDVTKALNDLQSTYDILKSGTNEKKVDATPYVQLVNECEYVINVSGDMWGDNAEHVGRDRFYVDCLKMQVAQLLGKKTILYAVTPGPFQKVRDFKLAKEVFEKFSLVVIREKVSLENLKRWGFKTDHVIYAPCPSFLFEADCSYESKWTKMIDEVKNNNRAVVGMTFGGFNMPEGPYDMWPRSESQYENFREIVEHVINQLNGDIILFSHTNGFDLPPNFKLKNGRDFDILNDFYHVLIKINPKLRKHIILVNEPLVPKRLKAMIGKLDMLITGRVHASVASTSQYVPTVFVEYDQRIIYSDKMSGFSEQIGLEDYVCEPGNLSEFKNKVDCCFHEREIVHKKLCAIIPQVQKAAQKVYEVIQNV